MLEFEHAGDVIDSMLHLMLLNDERDRAAILREKNALRSQEEDFLDREKRRHKYERAKLQKDRAVSLDRDRAKWRVQDGSRRAASQSRIPGSGPPHAPLPAIPKATARREELTTPLPSLPKQHQTAARKEELLTLSQPRDERFVQQHPRRRHCEDEKVQTIIIARDDPKLARLYRQAPEIKRHATIVASRPGSDVHPALRDLPPTPPATPAGAPVPKVMDWVPPPRTSSKASPHAGKEKVEEGVAFPAVLGESMKSTRGAQVEIVKRKAVPVRKPVVVGERIDEVMGGSTGSLKATVGHTLTSDLDEADEDSWKKILEEW